METAFDSGADLRGKWYCRQISRDGKKHSLSGELDKIRVLASAKPCLNIVLELTVPSVELVEQLAVDNMAA